MIARYTNQYSIDMMCELLEVSPSGFYNFQKNQKSQRQIENEDPMGKIAAIHQKSNGVTGAPRIQSHLKKSGHSCCVNRVARLMKELNIQGIPRKRPKSSKKKNQRPQGISNHLERDFQAATPNEKWVTDITYISTGEGTLYLSVVLDCCTDVVVGRSMSSRQTTDLAIDAVKMSLNQKTNVKTTFIHSDRGSRFTSRSFQQFLKDNRLVSSMSAVGSCADNAACEGFFDRLKRERVNRTHYSTRQEARMDIFDTIERFHNSRRRDQWSVCYNESALTKCPVK